MKYAIEKKNYLNANQTFLLSSLGQYFQIDCLAITNLIFFQGPLGLLTFTLSRLDRTKRTVLEQQKTVRKQNKYIVGCQGVVQLGGLPGKSNEAFFYKMKSSLVLKIKNNLLYISTRLQGLMVYSILKIMWQLNYKCQGQQCLMCFYPLYTGLDTHPASLALSLHFSTRKKKHQAHR